MGSAKKSQRNVKPQAQMRSRTTRSSKGRLLSDPAQNTQLLTEQLRSLGLYAAPTLGDGNCLFRALSDQLYGTPSRHLQLREDICDWIQAHKTRYEPFVEDDRGLNVHLRCMRENATYGGHMELSAFAHLTRRNVKVIQPGLVYVIEWAAGGDPSAADPPPPPTSHDTDDDDEDDSMLNDRERRRLRRDKKRAEKEKAAAADEEEASSSGTIYVAYHDWEHFSSIRNLKGPHTGLPLVQEASPDAVPTPPTPKKKSTPSPAKPIPKVKLKLVGANKSPSKQPSPPTITEDPPTPAQIPLPASPSRSPTPSLSPSPTPSHSHTPFSLSDSLPVPPFPPSTSAALSHTSPRIHRSPKRSFDESSAGSGSGSGSGSESVAKRTRSSRLRLDPSSATATTGAGSKLKSTPNARPLHTRGQVPGVDVMDVDVDADIDPDSADTPGLSAPGSSSSSSAASSAPSSAASSPAPPAEPEPEPEPEPEAKKPLTRRQRKALGLPKARPPIVAGRKGAGKIVIPGGRYKVKKGVSVQDGEEDGEEEEEWRRNGTGRVDVRGFRELKI